MGIKSRKYVDSIRDGPWLLILDEWTIGLSQNRTEESAKFDDLAQKPLL